MALNQPRDLRSAQASNLLDMLPEYASGELTLAGILLLNQYTLAGPQTNNGRCTGRCGAITADGNHVRRNVEYYALAHFSKSRAAGLGASGLKRAGTIGDSREGWQNYQNAFDPSDNYGNSNSDIRNMFKGQAIYQLPFGRGQRFPQPKRMAERSCWGWQASFTWVVQDGNLISIATGGNNTSNSGSARQYANLVGNYLLQGSTKDRLEEWYNLDAFAVPVNYTYGNFRRNIVTGF